MSQARTARQVRAHRRPKAECRAPRCLMWRPASKYRRAPVRYTASSQNRSHTEDRCRERASTGYTWLETVIVLHPHRNAYHPHYEQSSQRDDDTSKQSSIVRLLAKFRCPIFRAVDLGLLGCLGYHLTQPRQRNARSVRLRYWSLLRLPSPLTCLIAFSSSSLPVDSRLRLIWLRRTGRKGPMRLAHIPERTRI